VQRLPSGKTRLSRCHHQGPLYVQKAFYPEGTDLAHLYLLHPPGGIVSGDALQIDIDCEANAQTLVTTPGAGRIYRARDTFPRQQQRVAINVAEGACVEWFPLETIVFDGACVELATTVNLARGGHYIGWEVTCFGLPASEAPLRHGSFRQRYRIMHDGMPVYVDGLDINQTNMTDLLQGPATLRSNPVLGVFLAGPFDSAQGTALVKTLRETPTDEPGDVSLTGDFLVGRYLGDSAERARQLFGLWWQQVRPALLQRPACAPRIWLT
jgi:urease accessory protein